jgi:carbamoyltransferase
VTTVLGISAFGQYSAAALVIDGHVAAAASEESFTRDKHDAGFPAHAIDWCLKQAGLKAEQLDQIGFAGKPFLEFDRLLETYLSYAPGGFRSFLRALPQWLRQKLHIPREIQKGLKLAKRKGYLFTERHGALAASAFFPSPFDEAAILTVDGVGEWATASYGTGKGNQIALTHEQRFPHSLGLFYSAFTHYCGFAVTSGEYELMGLAPYGEPKYVDLILDHLLDLKKDGSLRLDLSYFNYCQGLTMTNDKFHRLFGGPPRKLDTPLTEHDMNIACSVQKVTEEVMLRMARHVHRETGMKHLCLAGDLAANGAAARHVLREGPFENVWTPPATGDAGAALGVAQFISHQLLGVPRQPRPDGGLAAALAGPAFTDEEIEPFLKAAQAAYTCLDDDQALCEQVAEWLAEGKVVGWFQGRMELGPYALGSRSVLADPRPSDMHAKLSLKLKFRQGLRPFAAAVLRERAGDYFDLGPTEESPCTLRDAKVLPARRRPADNGKPGGSGPVQWQGDGSEIPAVTHVNNSTCVLTVDAARPGLFPRVLEAFHRRTGCPVLINTNFRLDWEPPVCTPRDAYQAFMASDLDVLCLGHFVLTKPAQVGWVPAEPAGARAAALEAVWCSPCCQSALSARDGQILCGGCGHAFPVDEGIPLLFWPHEAPANGADITEMVKAFYEKTPFPNYDDHDSVRSLIEKSRRGLYANKLNQAVPFNGTVLEVGCGTGQLTNFLGVSCRRVFGADLCLNSLRLAEGFRSKHGLHRVRFVQMNLFRPCFKPGQFDVVLCNGVLLTTHDPFAGFRSLVPLVRPGGHLVIGLYNTFGRLATDFRRVVFRLTGGRGQWLDPYLRSERLSEAKRRAWFADQYLHPHETKQTIGEVLGWFRSCGLEFVRGIPSVTVGGDDLSSADLFDPAPPGSRFDHFLVQLKQVYTGSREGGFFVMIARKPPQPAQAADATGGVEPRPWVA